MGSQDSGTKVLQVTWGQFIGPIRADVCGVICVVVFCCRAAVLVAFWGSMHSYSF